MYADAQGALNEQVERYRHLMSRATQLIQFNGALIALFFTIIEFRSIEIPIYITVPVISPLLLSMLYAWWAHRPMSHKTGYSPRDFKLVYDNQPDEIPYRMFMIENLYNPAISEWRDDNVKKVELIRKSIIFFGIGIVTVIFGGFAYV